MDKRSTRAFSFGLLLSAILLLIFQQFFNGEVVQKEPTISNQLEEKNVEIAKLKAEVAQWQTDYEDLVAEKAKESDKNTKSKTKKYTLTISEGMSSKEISSELEKAEIISDAKAFNDFLGERKLQRYIQIGKYELDNEMNFEQMAEAITKES